MLERLQDLGLTEYQSKVIYALASLGTATAKGVAAKARLPQNKVYEVLEQLEAEGIVVSRPLRPKEYLLESVGRLRERALQRKQQVDEAIVAIDALQKLVQQPMPGGEKELFWIIKGQRNIIAKLNDETPALQHESFGVVRNLQSRPESIRALAAAARRGVDVRLLCSDSPEVRKRLALWRGSGVRIRLYDERALGAVGSRFSVLDKRKARITIGAPEVGSPEEYITLWCESRSFAMMMRSHFLYLWKKGRPVKI
jgi:sugar-specific transcriptional regulator TrmB